MGDVINANKNFDYKVKEKKARHVPLGANRYTTTCTVCDFTCHNPCPYEANGDKSKCKVMDSRGYCTVCPSKCHWTLHKNMPYKVVWSQTNVTRTAQDLRDKYVDAKSKQSAEKQIMAGVVKEFEKANEKLNSLINDIRNCTNELSKISLRPNVMSQVDYIDKLMRSEEAEKKPGFQQRVLAL